MKHGWIYQTKAALAWADQSTIMGLPADIVAHLFVGFLIYVFFLKRGHRHFAAIGYVLLLAVFKETFIDLQGNLARGEWLEPLKDVMVSLILPILHSCHAHMKPTSRSLRVSMVGTSREGYRPISARQKSAKGV